MDCAARWRAVAGGPRGGSVGRGGSPRAEPTGRLTRTDAESQQRVSAPLRSGHAHTSPAAHLPPDGRRVRTAPRGLRRQLPGSDRVGVRAGTRPCRRARRRTQAVLRAAVGLARLRGARLPVRHPQGPARLREAAGRAGAAGRRAGRGHRPRQAARLAPRQPGRPRRLRGGLPPGVRRPRLPGARARPVRHGRRRPRAGRPQRARRMPGRPGHGRPHTGRPDTGRHP